MEVKVKNKKYRLKPLSYRSIIAIESEVGLSFSSWTESKNLSFKLMFTLLKHALRQIDSKLKEDDLLDLDLQSGLITSETLGYLMGGKNKDPLAPQSLIYSQSNIDGPNMT